MMDTNLVIVTGRLTRDPDVRTTQTGKSVADFGIAVGSGDKTYFGSVTAWNHTADYIRRNARKGTAVLVSGRLTRENWTDRNGVSQSKTRITAETVEILTWDQQQQPSSSQEDLPYA